MSLLPALLLLWAAPGPGQAPAADLVLERELLQWSIQELPVPAAAGAPFTAPVVLDGWFRAELALAPHSNRAPGFHLFEDGPGGPRRVAPPPPCTYRGEVAGIPGSLVAASLTARGLSARIDLRDGGPVHLVQPLSDFDPAAAAGLHVVYRSSDVLPASDYVLAPPVPLPGAPDLSAPGGPEQPDGGDADVSVRIAFDADFEFYQKNGSSSAQTLTDVEAILNGVAAIYQADFGICYRNAAVVVRTSSGSNPYTTSDPSALLSQFSGHWNVNHKNIPRDVTHLMTGRNLSGSVIGIAYPSVVCRTSSAYALSESRFTSNLSQRVALTAHELGHNWGAGHCCGGCSGCSSCRIMCPCLGGCSGIINSFGTTEAGEINRYKRYFATCVTGGCGEPGVLRLFPPLPGYAGVTNDVVVEDGTPNGAVELLYGALSGSTAVAGCSGLFLDVAAPASAGFLSLDAYGRGSLSKTVPAGAAGQTFLLQALELASCRISNLVIEPF